MSVQIIEKDGQPEWAVIPYSEYQKLVELAEDVQDIADAEDAINAIQSGEETYPLELVERLTLGNEHPIKVWREYRELSQESLACAVDVGKSYISQIESGKKNGSAKVLKAIAKILEVDLEDLLPD